MADIKDLIGAIVNKDALAVKEIFSDIIGAKIGERMDSLRPLVAADMFNEGKMKCEECGYGMAKEDSNCKKCGCSMNEDYDWDSYVEEEINEADDNVKDDAPDTVAKDHPLVQLKKILDTKGGAFRTSTGKTVNVDHASAKRLLALHNATQKTEVKQKFAAAIHRDPIGTHDKFFPNAKINEADQAMVPIGGPIKVMPKHDSNRIFTYYGKGGYYGGSHTHVNANPKGDKHERFQVTHQGPDKGGPHGMPAMKVSYHPDALSAQAHAEKLAGKGAERVREEKETRAYLDWDDRDNAQNRRSLEKIVKKHGGRVTSAGGPGNNDSITFQGGKNNLHARIKSKLARAGTDSRTREIAEGMAGYTATSEPTKGGHSAVVKDSEGRTRYAGGSVYSSPEHAVKGAKAYINAGGGEYGSDMERSHHKHVTMMAKEEYELDEAGMPSGVASHKTMLRNMSDADFAASPHYGKMTDDTLRSMAWGHGYGKPGTPGHNHYVNKKKDGLRALSSTEKKD